MLPGQFFHFQFNFFLSSPKQMIWRRVISSTMSLFDWIWWSLRGHFQEDPCNDFWRVLVQFTWTATCLRPVTDLFFANKYFWWTSKKQSSFFYPHWRMIWWNGLFFNCSLFHNSHFDRTYAIGLDPWRPRKASNYYNTVVQWTSIFPLNFTSHIFTVYST